MKAYSNYSATPLPWLPQIPSHWSLARNKNIFQEAKEIVGDNANAYPLLSLTKKGIILRDVSSGKGKFPKDFNTYKIVKPGDMAFCLFDIDETPRTVGLSNFDGMLTGAYTIFHVSNINPRYAYYYCRCGSKGQQPLCIPWIAASDDIRSDDGLAVCVFVKRRCFL